MDYLIVVLLASFTSAFVVSVVDYWLDTGIGRAGIALGTSAVAVIPFGLWWPFGVLCALSSGFLSMFLLTAVERMNLRAVRGMR